MDYKKNDIKKLLAMEIIRRVYYQAGTIEESLKDDVDFEEAVKVLNNAEAYAKALGKK